MGTGDFQKSPVPNQLPKKRAENPPVFNHSVSFFVPMPAATVYANITKKFNAHIRIATTIPTMEQTFPIFARPAIEELAPILALVTPRIPRISPAIGISSPAMILKIPNTIAMVADLLLSTV